MATAAASTVAASLSLASNIETVNYEDVLWCFYWYDNNMLHISHNYINNKHGVFGYYKGKTLTRCKPEESNVVVIGYPDKNVSFMMEQEKLTFSGNTSYWRN